MKDVEIYGGKNFTDLLQEIHNATLHKRKRIDELIIELRRLIRAPEDAAVIAPIIADYLEVMVKNDEHLVKVAAIIQRIISAETKHGGGGDIENLLSDDEKEKLMSEALKELDEATKEIETKTVTSGSVDL